jgi:excisionase family DNA binding protein
MSESLLTTAEAAKYLCVSIVFLERDRWAGPAIPFIRVGARAVRYRRTDLEAFVSSRLARATREARSAPGARAEATDPRS